MLLSNKTKRDTAIRKECEGCLFRSSKRGCRIYPQDIVHLCPCIKCLVKTVCMKICPEFEELAKTKSAYSKEFIQFIKR